MGGGTDIFAIHTGSVKISFNFHFPWAEPKHGQNAETALLMNKYEVKDWGNFKNG